MAKLRISTGIVLAVAGVLWAVDGWAADSPPPKTAPAAAASAPKACTDPWSFIATDCVLSWYGITVYGTVDIGVGWQTHGAPSTHDPLSEPHT
jgi:hypothetical protein